MTSINSFSPQPVAAASRIIVATITLCAGAGCWQEVEYTGPDPASTSRATESLPQDEEELPIGVPETPNTIAVVETADTSPGESNGFADDFANSLAEPPAEPTAEPEGDGTLSAEGDTSTAPSSDALVGAPTSTPPADDPSAVAVDKYAIPAPAENTLPIATDTTVPDTASTPTDIATIPDTSSDFPVAEPSTEAANSSVVTNTEESATDASMSATQSPSETTTSVADTTPEANGDNPRLNAWRLGSKLSLAALANDRGLAAESVQNWLAYCKELAAALQTTVGDLPARGLAADRPASRQVLNYVVHQQGQQIGRDLTNRYGPDAAALFEVAVKSNLLLVLYAPGTSSSNAIAAAISGAAPRAQLPADLWQPLVNMVTAQADAAEIRKAVKSLHAEVERYLAERAEQ